MGAKRFGPRRMKCLGVGWTPGLPNHSSWADEFGRLWPNIPAANFPNGATETGTGIVSIATKTIGPSRVRMDAMARASATKKHSSWAGRRICVWQCRAAACSHANANRHGLNHKHGQYDNHGNDYKDLLLRTDTIARFFYRISHKNDNSFLVACH